MNILALVRDILQFMQDPDDECCDVTDDKKASLLMMNFTMEEVEFAINKLGILTSYPKLY